MAIDSDYDDLFDKIRGNLGEHFSNYMFIVMDDDGDLFYDYSNQRVGRMLIRETAADMTSEPIQIIWDNIREEDDDDDED
tara:strand:+ start:772 stop:1011 length:240 start_codon:yes stop_codon:yes gene_type:complete